MRAQALRVLAAAFSSQFRVKPKKQAVLGSEPSRDRTDFIINKVSRRIV